MRRSKPIVTELQKELEGYVLEHFKGDRSKADLWWMIWNPVFDMEPRQMLRYGRGAKVKNAILEARASNG